MMSMTFFRHELQELVERRRGRERADPEGLEEVRAELLYLRGDGTLMSVPVETALSFMKGVPVPLFKTALTGVDPYRLEFVPSADGKRLLMSAPISEADLPAIRVVLNWPASMKRAIAPSARSRVIDNGGHRR